MYDDDEGLDALTARWPLHSQDLLPRERLMWFERLWQDAIDLRNRYRLPVRSGWWTNSLQVEALAAFAAWVDRYDSGEWDDPPGKLALLYEVDKVAALLRVGDDPFVPDRDRAAFVAYLRETG